MGRESRLKRRQHHTNLSFGVQRLPIDSGVTSDDVLHGRVVGEQTQEQSPRFRLAAQETLVLVRSAAAESTRTGALLE